MRLRLALVLVAVATLLLPLLYLALVVLAGCLVYLHLVYDTWILKHGSILMWVAYFGPAVAGAVLVFFLWKPILARSARDEPGLRIEPAEAPLLFHFVNLIRTAVRATPPREIRLDTRANASAGLRRGLLSFVRRSDLTLIIGTPLLAGMSARQLGGVLAHEFGHFAQGSGMRLTYLIRMVNAWLVRVAYQRDSWDDALARTAHQSPWVIALPLRVAMLAVMASRKVLAGLALVGHAIGTFTSREMEMDADRYEMEVSGSDTFESTALRVRLLSVGWEMAIHMTAAEWREGRLPDDFGGLVAALVERLPAETRAEIQAVRPKGSIFDTHPPDDRRIAAAKAQRAPGILRLDSPASALLGDGSPLPQRVSLAFYKSAFPSGRGQVRPLPEILAGHEAKRAEHGAVERYFGGLFDLLTPFGLPSVDPVANLADGLESLREARETALRLRPDGDRAEAARAAARERLAAALALLGIPEARALLGDSDAESIGREVAAMGHTLAVLGAETGPIGNVTGLYNHLVDVFNELARDPEHQGLQSRALRMLGSLHVEAQILEQRLGHAPYPFEHSKGTFSIGGFVTHGLPDVNGIGPQVHARTQVVLERLAALHHRALGRLAVLAERIEAAVQPPSPD